MVFVIVRDTRLIRRLKDDFAVHAPISAFIYADISGLPSELPKPDRDVRVASAHLAYQDYLRDPRCYDEVVLRPSDRNGFYQLVDLLVERASQRRTTIGGLTGSERIVIATSPGVRNGTRTVLGGTGIVAVLVGVSGSLLSGNDAFTGGDAALLVLCLVLLVACIFVTAVLLADDKWRPLE